MYVKLFRSMYEGSLCGKGDHQSVLMNLLSVVDREGIVDRHPMLIAFELGKPIELIKEILHDLESPDAESRTQDCEGRRLIKLEGHGGWGWKIVNYEKYRKITCEAERREYLRVKQSEFRARQAELLDGAEPKDPGKKFEKFVKPTIAQLQTEFLKLGMPSEKVASESEEFLNHYESNGWKVGKVPMKSWPHAVANWNRNFKKGTYENNRNARKPNPRNIGLATDPAQQSKNIVAELERRKRESNANSLQNQLAK